MREIVSLRTEVGLQERLVNDAGLRETSLRGELDQRGNKIDELEAQLAQAAAEAALRESSLRGEMDQRGKKIDELEAKLAQAAAEATLRESSLRGEMDQRGQRVDAIAALLNDSISQAIAREVALRGEMDQRGRRVDELTALLSSSTAQSDALRQQIAALYASSSWRSTAPLRALSIGLRRLNRIGYLGLALTGRYAFRALPLSNDAKIRIKSQLFERMSPVFKQNIVYALWQKQSVSQAATLSKGPGLQPVVSSPKVRTAEILPVADGHWEWKSYATMRDRIGDVLANRRASRPYQPRPIIDLAGEDPARAAARITLKASDDAPEVSVIVPVFNQLVSTVECLLSIASTEDELTFEVIVANDASTDRTREVLSEVPNLRLINQPENLGFLRNCNSAVREARGRRLVLLNNDTQVQPDWLAGLTRALDEPGVGAVGPRFVYPNGVLQEAGARIRREGVTELLGLNDVPENPRWSYPRDVDYVSGACIMLETAIFRELGGFTEQLAPAYCEDLDLCIRIRERGLRVRYTPEVEVVHHLSKSSDALGSIYKHTLIAQNMQYLSQHHQATFDKLDDLRTIAFYLPQYHPVRENNLWWGAGFTDWRNVTKARPNFNGHDQPRLPADLGYYDLRVPEVMEAQWELAARYGVDGFCYYYYWFGGHRLLNGPLDRLLDPNPLAKSYPFCLCWANENWTRRWDGNEQEILMAQRHSPDDDIAVINDLARYMRQAAYIRVRGKPLLIIYRVDLFPAFIETAERWRTECRRLGLGEIYLAMVESFQFGDANYSPSDYGCDAAVEFPAHYVKNYRPPNGALLNPDFAGLVAGYDDVALFHATRERSVFPRFRTVMPGWDNTPRQQKSGFILEDPTPGSFQAWMEAAIVETKRDLQGEERLLFINAWNEWAEGAYLEPDCRFGHAFLQAVRNARDAAFLQRGGGS
jgi:GT2 family glycosyltransferase